LGAPGRSANMPSMASDEGDVAIGRSTRLILARVAFGVFLVGIVAGIVIGVLDAQLTDHAVFSGAGDLPFILGFAAFPIIGYVLAVRRPDNAIGWVMLGMGLIMGLPFAGYGSYAIHGGPGGRDLGLVLEASDQPRWIPIVVIPTTFLLLLFPDGHLP
jgi:uncharacterized integral membrane protein